MQHYKKTLAVIALLLLLNVNFSHAKWAERLPLIAALTGIGCVIGVSIYSWCQDKRTDQEVFDEASKIYEENLAFFGEPYLAVLNKLDNKEMKQKLIRHIIITQKDNDYPLNLFMSNCAKIVSKLKSYKKEIDRRLKDQKSEDNNSLVAKFEQLKKDISLLTKNINLLCLEISFSSIYRYERLMTAISSVRRAVHYPVFYIRTY